MSLTNGFMETPPKIVRTYDDKLEHDGYFILDNERLPALMWVSKKALRKAQTVPQHSEDTVLDDE